MYYQNIWFLLFSEALSRKTQTRKSTYKQRERLGKVFIRPDMKQGETDLRMSVEEAIRNVKCLGLQRGWSELIKIIWLIANKDW